MARKKEAVRRKGKKSFDSTGADSKSLAEQLATIGLKVRDVIGDGNCLFRALADQLDGDDIAHGRHRQDVVRYMKEHRPDFEPFIEDDVPFDKHVKNLSEDGTYAGNDAIVAFARLHKLTVVIHQLGSPAWEVHGGEACKSSGSSSSVSLQLHILYHNSEHYSSVRRIDDDTDSPANVRLLPARPLPSTPPSVARNRRIKDLAENKKSASCVNPMNSGCDKFQSEVVDELDYAAEFVANVLASTKCRNDNLVKELCNDAGYYDFDYVCSQVFAIMGDSMPSSASMSSSQSDVDITPAASPAAIVDSGTAAAADTVDGSTASSGAKPKAQPRQSTKRRQQKQEKKARAALRHKQDIVGSKGKITSSDEDDLTPFVITQNIKVLQI